MLSETELKAFYKVHCSSYGLGIDFSIYELVNKGTAQWSADISCVLDAMLLWNNAVQYTLNNLPK